MADASTLRRLLASTSVPETLVEEVLGESGTPWLMGATEEEVAAETVLCHPPLARGEVRAVASPTDREDLFRLTVVAADRPGLLAGTAGVLAAEGCSIVDAMVTVLPHSRLALQRVAVSGPGLHGDGWAAIGERLRHVLGAGGSPVTPWRPSSPVTVETQPQGSGRVVVTVRAPDVPGLLHAAAAWFESHDCNVEACHATGADGRATDVFVVRGDLDPTELAGALGGEPVLTAHGGWWPVRLAVAGALLPWRLAGALLGASRRPGQPDTHR